ncbi:transducin/WD40 repeat-like superfamily protein [Artemisia annua]|uniref:Transducin/WD40 repeat-like superfamily protein n=1 Tax=Artemisia annua TaxID=35608 RepID=A0A2U1LCI2_ARTAN|nr:transducin/WD40 repeat-like superfamily protein [Artemisia annua]
MLFLDCCGATHGMGKPCLFVATSVIAHQDLGPYTLDYTASGRYMVAAGRKGHVALIDLHTMKPIKDMQVRETVRDVVFLHNELFFPAAQKKYTYIYNQAGVELHCLKEQLMVMPGQHDSNQQNELN